MTGISDFTAASPVAPRAVLWDMDGTLFDSTPYHWQAWQKVLTDEGYSLTRERFMRTLGVVSEASLRALVGVDLPQPEVERISAAKEACFRDLVLAGSIQFLPGVERWLERLRSEGWRQALATSAPRPNVDVLMRKLGMDRFFDAMVLAEDVSQGKPDPEVFILAAQRLGVARGRCIVIEDSPAGIEAARRAGICSIGVSSTGGTLAADCAVDSLDSLPHDFFERLLSSSCHALCQVL